MAGASEPVDGAKLLDEIIAYLRRFTKMNQRQSDALAAWVAHTYFVRSLYIVAYVHVFSAEKQCGKTVLMDSTGLISAHRLNCGDVSVAYIARSLKEPRTVFIDELDALFGGDKERAELIRGMLNSGYKKSGTYGRCVGPNQTPTEFPTFSPKMFAGIGRNKLPDTIRDRPLTVTQIGVIGLVIAGILLMSWLFVALSGPTSSTSANRAPTIQVVANARIETPDGLSTPIFDTPHRACDYFEAMAQEVKNAQAAGRPVNIYAADNFAGVTDLDNNTKVRILVRSASSKCSASLISRDDLAKVQIADSGTAANGKIGYVLKSHVTGL